MTTNRALSLDMLARMSEDWSDTTSAMLSVTIAMILAHFDRRQVTLPLDTVAELLTTYKIDRKYHEIEGRPYMTVTLEEIEDGLQTGVTEPPRHEAKNPRSDTDARGEHGECDGGV